jgi:BASS family bile acid:Na+ symporter
MKSTRTQIAKVALWIAAVCFIIALATILSGNIAQAGPYSIVFFIALAIGFRGFETFKGFAYTVMIFAAVTTALFYPQHFLQINGIKLAILITPLIQLIMFGMGTSMSFHDFVGVAKMPKGVFIGVFSHFLIMPGIGYCLAQASGFPPEIAAGIILIGCSPNGMASNVISYLAKANLALSITITAVSTLLAPIMTPLLMKLLAGAFIEIEILDMMWDIMKMVIIPITFGPSITSSVEDLSGWTLRCP